MARAHHAARRLAEAQAGYRAVLADDPQHAGALEGLGVLALQAGDPAAAIAPLEAALRLVGTGRSASLHAALAASHRRLGDRVAALAHYRFAAELQPASPAAAMSLGAAAADADAYAEAADAFARALRLDPAAVDARRALAAVLNRLGRHAEAAACCREAPLGADDPVLARSLAAALRGLGRPAEANALLADLLRAEPADLDLRYNLACGLKDEGRAADAVSGLRDLLRLAPDHAAARFALCMAHLPPLPRDEAEAARGVAAYAAELRALARWAAAAPADALADGVGASQPFQLPYLGDDVVALQRLYGGLVARAMAARFPPGPRATRRPGERIRVGVVSGFIRDHSAWRVPLRGWVEGLDRGRFELFGYHTGAQVDAETGRAAALFARFAQGPASTEAWRARILADRPHVLIHAETGMDPMAVRLAAQRLATLQCVTWGHPLTSGLPTVDAFLSSAEMEPPGAEARYTERLVRLPGLSAPVRAPAPQPPASRAAFGLPQGACLFWCAQSPYKHRPRHDEVFARIAEQAGDCRFLFAAFPGSDTLTARFRERLRGAFAQRGLDAERLCVILPRLPAADYASALAMSDVFLDGPGWSGCNSLLEALACGVPAVTLEGGALRTRHGAAILRAAGAGDGVVRSVDGYVAAAVRLARSPAARRALRARLASAPLSGLESRGSVAALERFLEAAVG